MSKPIIQDKIIRSLKVAESLYYRLVLLVGDTDSDKTSVLCGVADELGVPVLNINLELSAQLLDMTAKQRVLRLPKHLKEIIGKDNLVVILDNLEILFDKELKQDPLRLLQGMSRNHLIVASWNGLVEGEKLTYAEPSHPEYQSYNLADILIVEMDGTATVDSTTNIREAKQA